MGSRQEDLYELVGVVVHSGSASAGHYYSFIRERNEAHLGPLLPCFRVRVRVRVRGLLWTPVTLLILVTPL